MESKKTDETNEQILNTEDPLKQMTNHIELKDLIKHPVISAYITRKSKQFKWIYCLNFLWFALLIVLMSGTYFLSDVNYTNVSSHPTSKNITCDTLDYDSLDIWFAIYQVWLIIMGMGLLLRELIQIYLTEPNPPQITKKSGEEQKDKVNYKPILTVVVHALILTCLILIWYFELIESGNSNQVIVVAAIFLGLIHSKLSHNYDFCEHKKVISFLLPTLGLLTFMAMFTNFDILGKSLMVLIPFSIISMIPIIKIKYVSQSNFLEITLIVYLAYTMLAIYVPEMCAYRNTTTVTILLITLEFVLLLSEVFQGLCVYMLMLKKVATTFFKIFIIFVLFIVAFAMSFHALFSISKSCKYFRK